MLFILKSLPLSEQAIDEYVDAWRELLGRQIKDKHALQRALFDHMYDNLNILDGKAHSLIQLTGVLVAAYVVVPTLIFSQRDAPPIQHSLLAIFTVGLAYAAAAIFCCLQVIWVHWSSGAELKTPEIHIRKLIRVRSARTILFRRGWTFSGISWILIIGCTVLRLISPNVFDGFTAVVIMCIIMLFLAHMFLIFGWDRMVIGLRRTAEDD